MIADLSPAVKMPVQDADGKHIIRLADIKGLSSAKEIITDSLVNPFLHPDVYQRLGVVPCQGLLLYGPPGTGKTMFGKAIANELSMEFISVSLTEIKGKTAAQTIQHIADLFARARTCTNGSILFFDDCEELFSRPGNSKAYGVSQFLSELDGIKTQNGTTDRKKVFVLIATNRPWMIDSALLRSGRIHAGVYVGLPNAEAREQIIKEALAGIPVSTGVDISELVQMTEGFSGAEIFHRENGGGICNEACRYAARRWIQNRGKSEADATSGNNIEQVMREDFEKAFKTVVPVSVRNPEIIEKNKNFVI